MGGNQPNCVQLAVSARNIAFIVLPSPMTMPMGHHPVRITDMYACLVITCLYALICHLAMTVNADLVLVHSPFPTSQNIHIVHRVQ